MTYPLQPGEFPDDDLNPYASPRATIGGMPYAAPGEPTEVPCTLDGVLGYAWQTYRERWGICLAATVLYFVINVAIQLLASSLIQIMTPPGPRPPGVAALLPMGVSLVSLLFQMWLWAGFTLVMLRVARGRPAAIGALFGGGRYFLPLVGANILMGLALLGIMLCFMVPMALGLFAFQGGQGGAVFILITVVVVVVALFIGLRLSQIVYAVVDRGAGPLEALRLSMEITRGRWLMVLGLLFAVGIINLLGLLAVGVGLLVTVPYTMLSFAVLYLALNGAAGHEGRGRRKPLSESDFLG